MRYDLRGKAALRKRRFRYQRSTLLRRWKIAPLNRRHWRRLVRPSSCDRTIGMSRCLGDLRARHRDRICTTSSVGVRVLGFSRLFCVQPASQAPPGLVTKALVHVRTRTCLLFGFDSLSSTPDGQIHTAPVIVIICLLAAFRILARARRSHVSLPAYGGIAAQSVKRRTDYSKRVRGALILFSDCQSQ